MKRSQGGFTFIELMVVLAIIGVIAGITATTYRAARQGSRDSQRKADLKKIQLALENYYVDNGFYPRSYPPGSGFQLTPGNPITNKDGLGAAADIPQTAQSSPSPAPTRTYLLSIPRDPFNTAYLYVARPLNCNNSPSSGGIFCRGYCIYVKLENASGFAAGGQCSPTSAGYNFYVSQQSQ